MSNDDIPVETLRREAIEAMDCYAEALIDEAKTDERRHTAERVKDQVHAHMSTLSLIRLTYLDVARICDEVGGSSE